MRFTDSYYQDQIRAKTAAPATVTDTMLEEDLLNACTKWLTDHGFKNLTASNAVEFAGKCRGFFGHLPGKKAKGSPFMADIFIFLSGGRCLQIELKVIRDTGRFDWRAGQQEMVQAGFWKRASSLPEFVALIPANFD